MKFEKLYRDVVSRLRQRMTTTDELYPLDVINALNDGIRRVITEAIANRSADSIVTSQTLVPTADASYPMLKSAALTQPIFQTPKETDVVYNVWVIKQVVDLLVATTAGKGSKGIKSPSDNYFICVESYSGGVQSTTFNPRNVRRFALNDGGQYKVGTVVLYNNSYWKVLQDFENLGVEISEGPLFQKVYWSETDYVVRTRPMIFPYRKILNGLYRFEMDNPGIAVVGDTLYCTKDIHQVYIDYVPQWIDADLDDTLTLPTEWEDQIKALAIQSLAVKLGMEVSGGNS
jgi:hypothetical protein